jgi:3-methyladenine DNA glycosylase AlkD
VVLQTVTRFITGNTMKTTYLMCSDNIISMLDQQASIDQRNILSRYFKTGKGEYGEGDVFIGVTVPHMRAIARSVASNTSLPCIKTLLKSRIHEHRFTGFLILGALFKKASTDKDRLVLYNLYIRHRDAANNWDLVDCTAPVVIGGWLLNHDRSVLYELAESTRIWDRRIAIVSTSVFIRNGEFADTLRIARMLLNDTHDLIHKAVGWMLREVGKKSMQELESFLALHYKIMPRTMLRYAIERMKPVRRKEYLLGLV